MSLASQIHDAIAHARAKGGASVPIVDQLVSALFVLTRHSTDGNIWIGISRCLGELGAIDPSFVAFDVVAEQVVPFHPVSRDRLGGEIRVHPSSTCAASSLNLAGALILLPIALCLCVLDIRWQDDELGLGALIPHLITKQLLPSLRAASSADAQTLAAFTIQQLLALLREPSSSPEVVLMAGGAGDGGEEIRHLFPSEVRVPAFAFAWCSCSQR